ncbi:hypothetical protein [Arthrobacter bambusae]|uniref:hypothetical protein n=1 Tax=Arthrobacter bambusae TaxID=1338426 RepID=UPI0027819D96|nr:hypothetical protein [Arthrobacter bambusae]MDQ0098432.1 hypothetical protein [Arthrobacter bambusae]
MTRSSEYAGLNNELLINLMGVFWKVYGKIPVEIGSDNEDLVATAAMHRSIYTARAVPLCRGAA